jgi:hypothetical protein
MPNWCNNTLELQHDDPEMITRAKAAFKDGKLLNEFCPVPESLHIVAGSVGDPDEQKKLEEDTARNLAVHGYGNWYDYCVNEWGTKWDVGGDDYGKPQQDSPNNITMSFDSAWAPPTAAMDKFMALGFSVRLYYYEPGMCFAGIYGDDGDDYYDLSGMSSTQVAEDLPSELDEMFGIIECMVEWEEENSEDEENIDIDLDGGLSAINEQEPHENK